MRILLAGQKYFGAEVFRSLSRLPGVDIVAIAAPTDHQETDRLAAQADLYNIPIIKAGTLCAENTPPDIDLIIAAHSHDFIGEKTRLRARWGGIGYHPSLLPLHRGRDAVRWSIRMRERVTGGTVYRLSNRMDGGNILAQRHVFIQENDTAESLWRQQLAPLGVELLTEAVVRHRDSGYIDGSKQDESIATWEPSIDRPPAFRPDLLMLEHTKTETGTHPFFLYG